MDIVTLGAALNGSAEYVNSHFKGGSNIQIVDNPDGTQTINASGEVSSEDTVARAAIAEIKDGEILDSFGDVETALGDKANADNVYKLALTTDNSLPANTDLDNVKTVGCYYVGTAATVSTIINRPVNGGAFRLTIELGAGTQRPRQIYQEFNSYDKYIRYEASSGTWANWKKVECDVSTKQNTISDLSTIRSGAALGATAVQPETGKGLSTNDYTTAEKTKLAGIAEGAEVNEIDGIKVNNTTINPDANKVVNITVPTTAADVSAIPDTTKYATTLSLTINSSTFVMTGQLKDQNGDNIGRAQTIDLPLESVVVGGSYDSQTQKIVLTLQNGNTVEFSVADLVSGLQTELSENNKLNPAYINYDSTHRAVSDTEKSTWDGKQNALSSAQLDAVNSGITSVDVSQITTNKNNISKQQDTTAQGGNGYAIINGQRLYMGSATPTGTIPDNSIWLYNGMQIRTTATEEFTEFPVTIKANGEPLIDYTITGNTGGVAARTGNDFDKNNIVLTNLYPNQSTGEATQGSATTFSMVVPVDFEGDGVFWIGSTTPNRMRIAGYTAIPTEGATATFVDNSGTTETDYIINTFTIPANSNTSYLLIMLSAQSSTESELRTLLESVQVMVSRGNAKAPYEKYYCVPVVSGGVTTKLYIDTPLGLTDTLTYTQTGVAIPTSDGDNTISFSTTVQPSAMSVEYKGWHKV